MYYELVDVTSVQSLIHSENPWETFEHSFATQSLSFSLRPFHLLSFSLHLLLPHHPLHLSSHCHHHHPFSSQHSTADQHCWLQRQPLDPLDDSCTAIARSRRHNSVDAIPLHVHFHPIDSEALQCAPLSIPPRVSFHIHSRPQTNRQTRSLFSQSPTWGTTVTFESTHQEHWH